jgi:hypothetical protein
MGLDTLRTTLDEPCITEVTNLGHLAHFCVPARDV